MSEYLIKQGARQDYNYKEYILDEHEDIEGINIENCCPGSVAYITATGEVYMLNNLKHWIKQ